MLLESTCWFFILKSIQETEYHGLGALGIISGDGGVMTVGGACQKLRRWGWQEAMIKALCWLCDAVHFLYTTAMEGCEAGGDVITLGFRKITPAKGWINWKKSVLCLGSQLGGYQSSPGKKKKKKLTKSLTRWMPGEMGEGGWIQKTFKAKWTEL